MTWLHASPADLPPGTRLLPGHARTWAYTARPGHCGPGEAPAGWDRYVWATTSEVNAVVGTGAGGSTFYVYAVEPEGPALIADGPCDAGFAAAVVVGLLFTVDEDGEVVDA